MEKKNFFKSKIFFSLLSFFIPLAVYIKTLAPTVSFIDSGELATVCIKLGVAHPTGYPLFTVIGHLFSLLPFGEEVYRLNFMCAVLSSLALVVFFNLLVFVLRDFNIEQNQNDKKSGSHKTGFNDFIIFLISLAGTLLLAFSVTYWNISNSLEVYSLHQLLIISIIFVILKAANESNKKDSKADIYWLFFAFLLGLSFSNHLSTIFMSLGCLYFYFAINRFNEVSFKRIAIMAIPFLIAFSVYVYFPIRADNPVISWGYPANLSNFIRHFTGKQFSVWMFSSSDVTSKQFSYFISSFPKEFYYVPLILAVFGLIRIFNLQKKLFYFTFLLFGFNVLYAINYDIHDIDSYFILAYIVSVIWITFGILFFVQKFKNVSLQLAFASVLIALIPLYGNYKTNDESMNYFVKDYTMNVFKSAKPNSLILSTQWDFFVSASIYYQYVKGERQDLTIIDKELLRRSWYIRHIQMHYPVVYDRSKIEFETYYTELLKFENETSRYTNPKTEADKNELVKINIAFIALLNSLVDKNYNDKFIYTTFEIENIQNEKFAKDYGRVQEGVLIRVIKNINDYNDFSEPDLTYTITDNPDYYHHFIMNSYYNAYMYRANYLINKSRFDDAELLVKKATEILPNERQAMQLLNKINQLKALPK
ncbi:MAG: DUF2723 domain-containing protein [Ignavibacteria bacterium]